MSVPLSVDHALLCSAVRTAETGVRLERLSKARSHCRCLSLIVLDFFVYFRACTCMLGSNTALGDPGNTIYSTLSGVPRYNVPGCV